MKKLPTSIGPSVRLVRACAWCNPLSHIPLKKGEVYTHGICTLHQTQLLLSLKQSRLPKII